MIIFPITVASSQCSIFAPNKMRAIRVKEERNSEAFNREMKGVYGRLSLGEWHRGEKSVFVGWVLVIVECEPDVST